MDEVFKSYRDPRFLWWCMVRPPGPATRELPLYLIACETISGEKQNTELSNGHS